MVRVGQIIDVFIGASHVVVVMMIEMLSSSRRRRWER
jgi:hypothetical protein